MTTEKLDFGLGGVFHYCLCAPDGKEMWGKFVYREIIRPERVVWVNSFSNEQGGITRHPFSNMAWPLEKLSSVTLLEGVKQKSPSNGLHWIRQKRSATPSTPRRRA